MARVPSAQAGDLLAHRNVLVRKTHLGVVRGGCGDGVVSLEGDSFAKAPVGALRWQAPQEADEWTGVRETTQFGNACSQYGRIYGPGANNRYDLTIGTTLIQAVGQRGLPLPEHLAPGTSGRRPAGDRVRPRRQQRLRLHRRPGVRRRRAGQAANAVVVTANYRVGIFGFLDLPQLKSGDAAKDSGNFTMLDIIKALEFVRRIAHVRRQPRQRHADGPVGRARSTSRRC